MSIDCVILAAGLSSRMGINKMTLAMGEKTVIENCVQAFYKRCSTIIVVTGKYHKDIKQCLRSYSKVQVVYNKAYQQGMFESVKTGVRRVKAERFFLTPGDYPLLKTETVKGMANAKGVFISPVYKGRHGHPILLDKLFIPVILNSDSISLRDCLRDTQANREEFHVDDIGIVMDIDTAEEYKLALKEVKI